jgi:hypothetical protein
MYKKEEDEGMDTTLKTTFWQKIGRYEFEIVKTIRVKKYTGRIRRIAESK